MTKNNVMRPLARANAFVTAAVIASAALLPALLLSNTAEGAQLASRKIDMSATQTSEGSGRDGGDAFGQDVTYSVSFNLGTAHANLEGVVIDFCSDSPITGDTCTAPTGFDVNEGSLVIANLVGAASLTINAATDANTLVLSNATGNNLAGAATVSFDMGSTGGADGVTNPTTVGSFYARILTYTTSTVAAAYTSTVPGAFLDDGGIGLAVTRELTITARVQEVLEFCIGTETASLAAINASGAAGYDQPDSCTQISGTDLSLGVVDSNSLSTTSNIAVPNDGVMMVRTNASNGAVMYYKAEQNNSSGKLKIAGAACVGANFDDPCFNSVGGTRAAISAGTENFGMALKQRVTTTGGATNAVSCDVEYRGDATAGCTGVVAGNNYAWLDSGAFDTIASSAGPVDDELVALEFAATASPTTPTGLYTVTSNFVATATF
jgi:hypothetical protein